MKKYEIHKLANIVAMSTDIEQKALTADIKKQGQIEPAMLYRGKIVDGRCRYKSCNELGIELKVESLPNNMSIQQVGDYVKSVNTRRNLTVAQKSIAAYRDHRDNKITYKVASERWAITQHNLADAKYLETEHPAVGRALFAGKKVKVGTKVSEATGEEYDVMSGSIGTVRKYYENILIKTSEVGVEYEGFGDDEYEDDDGDKYAEMAKRTPNIIGRRLKATEDKVDKLTEDLNKVLSVLDVKQNTIARLAKKYVPEWKEGDK